jgi:hypothetical protein
VTLVGGYFAYRVVKDRAGVPWPAEPQPNGSLPSAT